MLDTVNSIPKDELIKLGKKWFNTTEQPANENSILGKSLNDLQRDLSNNRTISLSVPIPIRKKKEQLREMERVLICEGHAVIIGINPLSLWGLWQLFFCWWNKMPWGGQLVSVSKLKDWLSLLDFECERVNYFFFSPPFSNTTLLKKFLPLERLGKYCYPIFGGLYIVVAKKRVAPISPIKVNWKKRRINRKSKKLY